MNIGMMKRLPRISSYNSKVSMDSSTAVGMTCGNYLGDIVVQYGIEIELLNFPLDVAGMT